MYYHCDYYHLHCTAGFVMPHNPQLLTYSRLNLTIKFYEISEHAQCCLTTTYKTRLGSGATLKERELW